MTSPGSENQSQCFIIKILICFSLIHFKCCVLFNQSPSHLLQWQNKPGDTLLAAEAGQQLIGVHALAVPGLHQLGDDPLHLLLLCNRPEQLVVEDLADKEEGRGDKIIANDVQKTKEPRWIFGVKHSYIKEHVHAWVQVATL